LKTNFVFLFQLNARNMLITYTLSSTPRQMDNTITGFIFDYRTGSSQDLHTTTVSNTAG